MGEQRDEQAQILGALADQVFQVPLVFRQVGVIEAEREFSHVGAAPVGNRRGAIAQWFQQLRQRIDLEPGCVVGDKIVADAVGVRPGAGEQGDQAGCGARAGHIAVGEQRALRGQPIDMGRQRAAVAQRAKPVGAQRIRADHQDIGRLSTR